MSTDNQPGKKRSTKITLARCLLENVSEFISLRVKANTVINSSIADANQIAKDSVYRSVLLTCRAATRSIESLVFMCVRKNCYRLNACGKYKVD